MKNDYDDFDYSIVGYVVAVIVIVTLAFIMLWR